MAVIALIVLGFVANYAVAEIMDVTQTSILSEDTNTNDGIKLKQAFAQILVKNTGEDLKTILNSPIFLQADIRNGIKRSYFEKIDSQYISEDSSYRYWFHVVVSEEYLKRIITDAGFSLLPVNRHKIIFWIVKEDNTDVDVSSNENIHQVEPLQYVHQDLVLRYWIDRWADALGLNVVYPQLDSEDQKLVPVESIKSLSFQAVDQSNNKYGVNQILMLYIKKSTDYLRLRSGFVSGEDDIIINHYQESIIDNGSILYSLMADVANNYFQKNRIESRDLLEHNVRVVINGVENYNRVMQIQDYLSNLSVIESFDIKSASNGQLVLNVNMLIKTAVFLQIIERDKRLFYQQDSPMNQLNFRVINK